jgi:hypothetical protein
MSQLCEEILLFALIIALGFLIGGFMVLIDYLSDKRR